MVCNYNFARLFKLAFSTSITREICVNGFKKSGIYPFNREAVSKKNLAPTKPPTPPAISPEFVDVLLLPQQRVVKGGKSKRLDPSNQLLNTNFLQEIREDTETKKRLEKEKEERKKERERKRIEKMGIQKGNFFDSLTLFTFLNEFSILTQI